MIEQHARVEELDEHQVKLRPEIQSSGCHSCSLNSGCGTSLIAQLFPNHLPKQLSLPAQTIPKPIKVGDRVLLGLQESYLYQALILLYAIPLMGLLGGAVLGAWWASYVNQPSFVEPASILMGLLGLSVGVGYARHQSLRYTNKLQHHMQVLQVIPASVIPVEQMNTEANKLSS